MDIPKWILAAFVGAAPMLGMVFFILFSCTLLGLVQRCKINLAKSYAKRRRLRILEQASIDEGNLAMDMLLKPPTGTVIISPFDNIPMKDIDADSTSKGYSEPKDGKSRCLSDRYSNRRISQISHILRYFNVIEVVRILKLVLITIMVHLVSSMIMIMNKIVYLYLKQHLNVV